MGRCCDCEQLPISYKGDSEFPPAYNDTGLSKSVPSENTPPLPSNYIYTVSVPLSERGQAYGA